MSTEKDEKDEKKEKEPVRKIEVTHRHIHETGTVKPETSEKPTPAPAIPPKTDKTDTEDYQKKMADAEKKFADDKKVLEEKIATLEKEKGVASDEAQELREKWNALSLEEFEKEKIILVETTKKSGLSDEKVAEIEKSITPENIETVKNWVNIIASQQEAQRLAEEEKKKTATEAQTDEVEDNKPPAPAPVGSVSMATDEAIPTLPKGAQFKGERELVRNLYYTGYYAPTTGPNAVDPRKRAEARQKIKTLLKTLTTKTVKTGGKVGGFNVTMCPECYNTLVNTWTCDKCGWEAPKDARDILRRT